MVATSAYGLGVDIADITEVVLFGLPTKGSELVQLAGRGGRDPSLSCLVRFVIRDFDIKEHDEGLMKLVSGTSCIILRDILQSDETIEVNDLCCSVCNGCIRPSLFVPEVTFTPPASVPPASVPPAPTRTKRVLAAQKESLRRALIQLRLSADGSCALRGLDAVLPFHLIDKIVKSCRLLCTERDIYKLVWLRNLVVK